MWSHCETIFWYTYALYTTYSPSPFPVDHIATAVTAPHSKTSIEIHELSGLRLMLHQISVFCKTLEWNVNTHTANTHRHTQIHPHVWRGLEHHKSQCLLVLLLPCVCPGPGSHWAAVWAAGGPSWQCWLCFIGPLFGPLFTRECPPSMHTHTHPIAPPLPESVCVCGGGGGLITLRERIMVLKSTKTLRHLEQTKKRI